MSTNRKTRNIALTIEQDNFIENLIGSGQYQSASEVIRAGLRLLNQDIERHQVEINEIRQSVRTSLEAEAQGQYVEGTPKQVIGAAFDEVVKAHKV